MAKRLTVDWGSLTYYDELNRLREACEIVHATANGNTYGLTVEEQLEALRLAARHCSEAIGEVT